MIVKPNQADIDLSEIIMKRVKTTIELVLGAPVEVSQKSLPELLTCHRIEATQALQAENERLHGAAIKLRNAQRAYMADRGNELLGRQVGLAALELDEVLDAVTARTALEAGSSEQ